MIAGDARVPVRAPIFGRHFSDARAERVRRVSAQVLRFARYRLDVGACRLWRDDEALHLTPKSFELLRFLAERPGELVSKDALFRAVWPGTIVSDDALTRCMREVRRVLGDDARRPTFVETVHRRGFRFLTPVTVEAIVRAGARPFVGRDSALGRGRAVLAEALAGRAQRLFVCGEPGVGKTRLAEELADIARASGALPLWGRAHEGEGRPPFWIWKPVLEGCAAVGGVSEPAESLLDAHASAVGLLALPESREARFRTFDEVRRVLARAAARQPLFVVLDDLHAADADSLRLLSFLAQELGESRVVLVGTYRDVGAAENRALGELLERLLPAREGGALIELRGLERDEVRSLLAALTNDEVAERFAGTAHDKTGGNPLYLHELARLLADEKSAGGPSDWPVAAPETIRQVLRRRLDGLSAGCRDSLVLACIAGTEFSPRLLERASESGDAAFADGLHEARVQRLVFVDRHDSARFAHDLVREILYEGLRPGLRARLHRRIALAIESTSAARTEPPLAELAYHFGRAVLGGDLAKAIHYARLAGDRALGSFAFEEAAGHYDSVLELLESMLPLDASALCEAEMSAARAHFLCGRAERARSLAAGALEHARASDSAELLYQASANFCELEPSYPRDAGRIAILDAALARLGQDALAPRAHLLGLRGMVSLLAADPDDHLKCGREAVDLARRSGNRRILLESLRCLCFALLHPGDEPEWRDRYEEMIRVAAEEGSPALEFDARLFRLQHRIRAGSAEAIDRELLELDVLAERLRTPGARAALLRARAGVALARGALDDARHFAESALVVGRAVDAPLAQAVSLLQLSTLRHMQGRVGEALPDIEIGADLNPEIAMFQAGVIWVLCESGERDEARRRLQLLVDESFASLPRDVTYPMALANLALSCARLGMRAGAERLLELLRPWAGRTLTLLYYFSAGCASRELGLLASLLERWDEAALHFETALEVDRNTGERSFEVYVLVDYARMLRTRGDASSRAHAARLLAAALEIARELGMPAIEQEIAALAG
jgi:DNA-binding winged helix-turn-helix (wHTH) protein/tetratricopeptide (TPR) repeat protein